MTNCNDETSPCMSCTPPDRTEITQQDLINTLWLRNVYRCSERQTGFLRVVVLTRRDESELLKEEDVHYIQHGTTRPTILQTELSIYSCST